MIKISHLTSNKYNKPKKEIVTMSKKNRSKSKLKTCSGTKPTKKPTTNLCFLRGGSR